MKFLTKLTNRNANRNQQNFCWFREIQYAIWQFETISFNHHPIRFLRILHSSFHKRVLCQQKISILNPFYGSKLTTLPSWCILFKCSLINEQITKIYSQIVRACLILLKLSATAQRTDQTINCDLIYPLINWHQSFIRRLIHMVDRKIAGTFQIFTDGVRVDLCAWSII